MKRIIFLALLFLSLLTVTFLPPTRAVSVRHATGDWFFVVVETHVSKKGVEIDDEHPEERRWYVSNVVVLPENIADYSAKKKAGEYFDANVVNPAEKHGIAVKYYDDEMEINGGSVIAAASRAEAEDRRKKDLDDRKERGGNIYSFNLTFGPAKGEETSQPRLLYHDPKQPNYEPARN